MNDESTNTNNGLILVGVDGSQNSLLAVGVAARMAGLMGAHVGMVHVLDEPVMGYWGGLHDRMAEEIREEAEARLGEVAQRVQQACGMTPVIYIENGMPCEAITKLADSEPNVLMVVVGRQGLEGEHSTRLLDNRKIGHLVNLLSGLLPVPLLTVPPDVATEQICAAIDQLRNKS